MTIQNALSPNCVVGWFDFAGKSRGAAAIDVKKALDERLEARFGHTSIDLALDPLQLPWERLAYPDLKSVSPDGEVLYWECETGKVQRTQAERDAKWAAHCQLNHNHFYVFVPTNEAQKNVMSEINLWLEKHRLLQVWLALCQYAKAMRADNPAF